MEGVGSYIDPAVVGGILSGVLLAVAAAWVLFAQNALWRIHLRALSNACFKNIGRVGTFSLNSEGFGPQIRWLGTVQGEVVVVRLKGGLQGVRVQLTKGVDSSQKEPWISWQALEGGLEHWLVERLKDPRE